MMMNNLFSKLTEDRNRRDVGFHSRQGIVAWPKKHNEDADYGQKKYRASLKVCTVWAAGEGDAWSIDLQALPKKY